MSKILGFARSLALAILVCVNLWSGVSYAGSIGFGLTFERMATSNASPIESGSMNSGLLYLELGSKLGSANLSVGKSTSEQVCNDDIGIYRIDYAPPFVKLKKYFEGFVGLDYHAYPSKHTDSCSAGGAIINIPTPYLGVRKVLIDEPIQIGLEAQVHTFGFAVQARIGF